MCKSNISQLYENFNLRRHLETKHANLKNKPREFEWELRWLSSSKTCINATDTINKKGLEASYMVSYWMARTGKPHTILEDLIIPTAADMAGTTLAEKAKNTTDNVFIKQHCFTIHQWHGRICFETITASHTSQWILCITAGWVNGPCTAPGICPLSLWVVY